MPRPPLALGTWGEIRTYVDSTDAKGKPSRYRAITKYRDFDGKTRQVEKHGRTKAQAVNNLKISLGARSKASQQGELTAQRRFADAVAVWMEKFEVLVAEERRSPGSLDTYRRQLDLHILPALGDVRLGEMTTPLLDKFIGRMKKDVGGPTARSCRSVISGVLGLAVRYGALSANPIREVERVEGRTKKEPRALSEAERSSWLSQLAADPVAIRHDLPDLTGFMLGTGVRIGEALAVLWSEVNLDDATVTITSTIIRVKGVGLVRKTTKSRAGQRVLPLPSSVVAMLRARFMANPHLDAPVFPDVLGGFRDPSNTRRAFRDARGTDALAWVTSHVFRKTAATILDDAGLNARTVADQLGHARPSMTQDVYLGRKVVDRRTAEALEAAMVTQSSEKDG